jgi:methyl-accepting chemotaxis protein
MNLDTAISAHAAWKTKFRTAITAKEPMDAATIEKDNCCELGKWLHGSGHGAYSSKPDFTSLIQKHKAFHVEAGKVASLINAKKYEEAEKAIAGATPFGAASNETTIAINRLKKAISEAV